MKEAIARREFVKRQASKWREEAIVDDETFERIVETQSGHEDPSAPVLFAELYSIVASWSLFGEPVTVSSGLAVGISDNRPQLYPARLAWLSETGVTDPDTREMVLELWAVLDREKIACVTERLSKQMREARSK